MCMACERAMEVEWRDATPPAAQAPGALAPRSVVTPDGAAVGTPLQ